MAVSARTQRGTVGHQPEHAAHRRFGKAFRHDVVDQADQRLPVAAGVQQKDRLGMQSDLRPCQHFKEFVQRPRTAGSTAMASEFMNITFLRSCMSSVMTNCVRSRRPFRARSGGRESPPAFGRPPRWRRSRLRPSARYRPHHRPAATRPVQFRRRRRGPRRQSAGLGRAATRRTRRRIGWGGRHGA